MYNTKVTCVIVTYNRKDLLLECLDAVCHQSLPVSQILLIDNASTDGTKEVLSLKGYLNNPQITYVEMEKNTGGAGGFYEGIKRSLNDDSDWVWLMDDDTIPTASCLEELIKANTMIDSSDKQNCSFLASTVYGPNGEYLNVPYVNEKPNSNGYAYWYKYLKEGIVSIYCATFVSILIKKDAIRKCGFPNPAYFIWGDDTEYTTRLTRYYGNGYFVGNSVAIHKRKNCHNLFITDETEPNRIEMYRYFYRNRVIYWRYYEGRKPSIILIKEFLNCIKLLKVKNGFAYAKIAFKGTLEGLKRYNEFKKYIESQIK